LAGGRNDSCTVESFIDAVGGGCRCRSVSIPVCHAAPAADFIACRRRWPRTLAALLASAARATAILDAIGRLARGLLVVGTRLIGRA
jgi:hypothetical protein